MLADHLVILSRPASSSSDTKAALPAALLRPGAYPSKPDRVELIETHISWVFLAGADVYKVKKPVDFGFLDFRSLAQRREACDAEIELNQKLAHGIYLGVVPIRRDGRGVCRVDGPGKVVDWAVHMVRLADDRRADRLLARGELGTNDVAALADRLAAFHAQARCDAETARFGAVDAVRRNVEENFAQTRRMVNGYIARADADEIERRQTAYLRAHADIFERRVAQGRIRDGHGDLRLEHVYLDGTGHGRRPATCIDVIDCIEFSDRFRFADVCADIAFLSMDLAWHGRVDLAERLLARYAQSANDFDLYEVVDFYESYRAYVRAKVSMLLADEACADSSLRDRAAEEARRYLLLALSGSRPALLAPVLVCVGGPVASGKSTVAESIARELSAPVVATDPTRKHLQGVAPSASLDAPPWRDAYDPAITERVYAEVLRRASVVLSSGRPVVIDASFRSRDMRHRASDLATARGVPFFFVECRVAPEVARERLRRREGTSAVSDARLPLFDDFWARFEAVDEVPDRQHVVLDTGHPMAESLALLRRYLPTWPRGFVA
jgi:aminoglycoside phosphotransferase family enzyme/predicted kinase